VQKILNFGSLNIDHVYGVDAFVTPGETKLTTSLEIFFGGKGNNQSVALVRAGAQNVYHAGCVGLDGQGLVKALQTEGVQTQYIHVSHELTGHAIIQVNTTGENCILIFGGANRAITRTHISTTLAHFNAGDILLIQNEISMLPFLIETALKRGLHIYFNPAPFTREIERYPLTEIHTFMLNQHEAADLLGIDDSSSILSRFKTRFPNSRILLTLGEAGVYYQDASQTLYQPAYSVKAIDTTAAGDTFIGYFIAQEQSGDSLSTTLARATKAAALCVTQCGATNSIPHHTEI
jgi:ribokinase